MVVVTMFAAVVQASQGELMVEGEASNHGRPSKGQNYRLTREVNWINKAEQEIAQRRGPDRVEPSTSDSGSRHPRRSRETHFFPRSWEQRGVVDFMARAGEILVEDVDLPRVLRALEEGQTDAEVVDSLIGGVTLLRVDGDVDDVVEGLDASLGVGVAAPNHVLCVTPAGSHCPATEPDAPGRSDPWPGLGDRDDGRGVRVAVVDTGFLQGWESRSQTGWLAGITDYDVDDPDVLPPRNFIDPYAGHGTFISGVVRAIAPATEVTVDGIIAVAGVVDEASIVKQLGEGLSRSPDVINLSAGCYTRKNLPPKAFAAFWEYRLRHHKGVVVVAAAGNDGGRDPFWPAAFPWTVSVGALTADGRARAKFSNHGGWVDVYAPGVDIVNAYCEGEYRLLLEPSVVRKFDGMCKWSGTSFSTPMVAGLIAARMSRTGENGRQAADALLDAARGQFLPAVGPRLLP
jgi:subtilisin family serine protease